MAICNNIIRKGNKGKKLNICFFNITGAVPLRDRDPREVVAALAQVDWG